MPIPQLLLSVAEDEPPVVRAVESYKAYFAGIATVDAVSKACAALTVEESDAFARALSALSCFKILKTDFAVEPSAAGVWNVSPRPLVVSPERLDLFREAAALDSAPVFVRKDYLDLSKAAVQENAFGAVPTVKMRWHDEIGFVAIGPWAFTRTVQPVIVSKGAASGTCTPSKPAVCAVPFNALPPGGTLRVSPVLGGGFEFHVDAVPVYAPDAAKARLFGDADVEVFCALTEGADPRELATYLEALSA